jgi:cellulose synthase/poly-beta-1,6-N-acetylglucosamine synthase-like glycosyltransferase
MKAGSASAGAPWTLVALAGAGLVAFSLFGIADIILALTLALELLFFAFFARHLAFAISALRSAPADLAAPLVDTGFRPTVSVLVACKNEQAVAERLVAVLLSLDYPVDLLQLVVVDDASTDRTGDILDARAALEPRLRVIHRPTGSGGGKSGGLNAALPVCTGEIIVVFDADHAPRPDVLRRLVRHFEDPGVGAVQGRCEIRNPQDSPLTGLIAIDYLAGYLVNEYGRQSIYQLPAYGGANCAVRASSLRALGGWNIDTVTEDTDLTIRLILKGERVRYDVTAVDEEEGVVTLGRYWRQRYRWARGHQQVWREYRKAVWGSKRLSVAQRLETLMFLLVFHLPVVSAVGLVVLLLWLAGLAHPFDPLHAYLLWTLLFLGPLLELGGGLLVAQSDRRQAFMLALFLPMFFVSIALCTKAWIDGIAGRQYSWVKTKRSEDPLTRVVQ